MFNTSSPAIQEYFLWNRKTPVLPEIEDHCPSDALFFQRFFFSIALFAQPLVDFVLLEAPLVSDLDGRNFPFLGHPVNGRLVDPEVLGDLVQRHDGWSCLFHASSNC